MTYLSIITAAAKAAHVSATLLYAICAHESLNYTIDFSLYDNGSPSYSVCQIKEDTARMFGFKGDAMKLRDPRVGIKYAALYLKYQQDHYGHDWVKIASAYNAGTYNESSKVPGCPRNLKYVKSVQEKLDKRIRSMLDCGKTVNYIDTLEEYENN